MIMIEGGAAFVVPPPPQRAPTSSAPMNPTPPRPRRGSVTRRDPRCTRVCQALSDRGQAGSFEQARAKQGFGQTAVVECVSQRLNP